MTYIEAQDEWDGVGLGVFLAGGITGCPDWQAELRTMLDRPELVLLNPRRSVWDHDMTLPDRSQIEWEHLHLRMADAISFWFPAVSRAGCPIALYELGAWSMTDKPLFVGIEPGYVRADDVRVQTELVRPDVEFASTLHELAVQIVGGLL